MKDEWSSLDLLVNAVGRSARGRVMDTTADDFRELLELNFVAVTRCTQAFLPMLCESRGRIILIGSLASKTASPNLGAYPASKFPLVAYAQQLRMELEAEGVQVLLACPGPIRRDDAGSRYGNVAGVPERALQPGGGVRLKGLDPDRLSDQILKASLKGQPELVVPSKARWLFAIASLFPRWGDHLVKRFTS